MPGKDSNLRVEMFRQIRDEIAESFFEDMMAGIFDEGRPKITFSEFLEKAKPLEGNDARSML